jgi:hypothetical protein
VRSGPKAIQYQGTLFRASELVWVKSCPLPHWKLALKYGLMAMGIVFFLAVAWAKDTAFNIEGILGFFALHLGYTMQSDIRLASSGDLFETYESRGGSGQRGTFEQWIQALSNGNDECKIGGESQPYSYWFNLQRVAWARFSRTFDLYGLTAVPLFLGYNWVISKNFTIPLTPLLQDIHFLQFEGHDGLISMLCWVLAALGVAHVGASIGSVLEVRATGGLTDYFNMNSNDANRFLEKLAGNIEQKAETPAAPAKPVSAVQMPAPAAEKPKAAPAPVENPAEPARIPSGISASDANPLEGNQDQ